MQKHTLIPHHKNKKSPRVGRGGRRGKTSGKGHKGQKARAGHKIRPAVRDIIKAIPKLRGHASSKIPRTAPAVVNLADLEKSFPSGGPVTPQILVENAVVRTRKGAVPPVKILARGDLSVKLEVSGCTLSAAAQTAIEKAGGSVAGA